MQMSIIEVFICRRLHMNTSMILICIWLICRLCTALHTKCCGAVIVKELIEAEANISQANKVSTVFVTVSFHNLCTGGEHVAQRLLL